MQPQILFSKKRFLLILMTIFTATIVHSQFIAKFNLRKSTPIIVDVDNKILEVNNAIKKFNADKKIDNLTSLIAVMKKNNIHVVNKKLDQINEELKNNSLLNIKSTADTIPIVKSAMKENSNSLENSDSTDTVVTVENSVNSNCEEILNRIVGLKNEKQSDGNYQFTFFDKNEEPIKAFIIKQFNETLFKDKLIISLHSLCNATPSKSDSDWIKTIVDDLIERQKLYDRMLEASLEVGDEKDLAGVMTIIKKTHLHITIEDAPKLPINTDEKANEGKQTYPKNKKGTVAAFFDFNDNNKSLAFYNNENNTENYSFIPKNKIIQQTIQIEDTNVEEDLEISKEGIETLPNVGLDRHIEIDGDRIEIHKFTIHRLQVQFQDGFIENIQIFGKMEGDDHLLQFSNFYPIRFSTKSDFSKIIKVKLYEKTVYSHLDLFLQLGEVITYAPNFALDTKDYSPENQVWPESISDNITDNVTNINLFKEQTSKILEAKIFTDLKGIDGENPNGLVQLELTKKINLLSFRFPVLGRKTNNMGLINYVTPVFGMNKIESNQKRLTLSRFDTISAIADTNRPLLYTSSINLLRHQIYHVGLDLTAITLDFTTLKSVINFGWGLYFGRSALRDTIRDKSIQPNGRPLFVHASTNNIIDININTFQSGPFISWQIYPNKKYGFGVTQRLFSFKALSNEFVQVRDSAQYVNYITGSGKSDTSRSFKDSYSYSSGWKKSIGSAEIFAFFRPSTNTKIFFRYRLNWDWHNSKENFHQMQIGLATTLTTTKESNAKSASKQQQF